MVFRRLRAKMIKQLSNCVGGCVVVAVGVVRLLTAFHEERRRTEISLEIRFSRTGVRDEEAERSVMIVGIGRY